MSQTQAELQTEGSETPNAIDLISQPLTLPCGLTLPNRLVKCPMQETLAQGPWFDPPMSTFSNLYGLWARSQYGLLITGQVQVDRRFLSIAGDVCCHERSTEPETMALWKEWARTAQKHGTPCIVQLAHPGRMSPAGAGIRPPDLRPLCPSEVPVELGDSLLDKWVLKQALGTPKAMTLSEIDEVVAMFMHGAEVARDAGFAGCQLHAAHGFLISQFLSPRTNRRTDEYGGTPQKQIRAVCPPPCCLAVKLNSADYMAAGEGLEKEEGLEQVRWLRECGMVDFVDISGGNAETQRGGLRDSLSTRSTQKAEPMRASTRIREAFYTDFADQVMKMESNVPVQLSGGFRTLTGMADAVYNRTCDLIGLGRPAILEPELPSKVLLNPAYDDEGALAQSHQVRGQWLVRMIPAKIVGLGLLGQVFYHNMKRLERGLSSDPDVSIPGVLVAGMWESLFSGIGQVMQKIFASSGGGGAKLKSE